MGLTSSFVWCEFSHCVVEIDYSPLFRGVFFSNEISHRRADTHRESLKKVGDPRTHTQASYYVFPKTKQSFVCLGFPHIIHGFSEKETAVPSLQFWKLSIVNYSLFLTTNKYFNCIKIDLVCFFFGAIFKNFPGASPRTPYIFREKWN